MGIGCRGGWRIRVLIKVGNWSSSVARYDVNWVNGEWANGESLSRQLDTSSIGPMVAQLTTPLRGSWAILRGFFFTFFPTLSF